MKQASSASRWSSAIAATILAGSALGCGEAETTAATTEAPPNYDDPNAGFDEATVEELEAHGFGKYLGAFSPSTVETTDGGLELYTFATEPPDGPICMKGDPFVMSLRGGSTDDLLIYLQGGGACWTGKCAASTLASGFPYALAWTDGDARNPLGSFPLAFISYCDGSVFAGDADVPDPANGDAQGIRRHHGLKNLSASLDIAHARYPHPRRIVVAGSSAGGYGTIIATAVVRLLWPKTALYVINDAGPGLTNPADPDMYDVIVDEWNVAGLIPASCTECDNRQFTPLIGWALEHDPTIRAGAYCAYEDEVIAGTFLEMTGPDFKALLLEQTSPIHEAFPDRFERFFVEGAQHTAVIAGFYDLEVDGQALTDWTEAMIDSEEGWVDRLAGGG